MTRQPKSALRVLIEERYKAKRKNLARSVTRAREAGDSWQSIADAIYATTAVRVTGESLRGWFGAKAEGGEVLPAPPGDGVPVRLS